MKKILFYVILIISYGITIAIVLEITNLPDHFWYYFFAFGFVWLCLLELFGFLHKKLFQGEKMFGSSKDRGVRN